MRKWICLIRHTTYNYHWSFSEERSLRKCMESNTLKSKWSDLAIAIYKGSGADILRTCKDVREHWKNYLDPQLKKYGFDKVGQFGPRTRTQYSLG